MSKPPHKSMVKYDKYGSSIIYKSKNVPDVLISYNVTERAWCVYNAITRVVLFKGNRTELAAELDRRANESPTKFSRLVDEVDNVVTFDNNVNREALNMHKRFLRMFQNADLESDVYKIESNDRSECGYIYLKDKIYYYTISNELDYELAGKDIDSVLKEFKSNFSIKGEPKRWMRVTIGLDGYRRAVYFENRYPSQKDEPKPAQIQRNSVGFDKPSFRGYIGSKFDLGHLLKNAWNMIFRPNSGL